MYNEEKLNSIDKYLIILFNNYTLLKGKSFILVFPLTSITHQPIKQNNNFTFIKTEPSRNKYKTHVYFKQRSFPLLVKGVMLIDNMFKRVF